MESVTTQNPTTENLQKNSETLEFLNKHKWSAAIVGGLALILYIATTSSAEAMGTDAIGNFDITNFDANGGNSQDQIQALEKALKTAQAENIELKHKYDALEQKYAADIKAMNAKYGELDAKYSSLQKQINDLPRERGVQDYDRGHRGNHHSHDCHNHNESRYRRPRYYHNYHDQYLNRYHRYHGGYYNRYYPIINHGYPQGYHGGYHQPQYAQSHYYRHPYQGYGGGKWNFSIAGDGRGNQYIQGGLNLKKFALAVRLRA